MMRVNSKRRADSKKRGITQVIGTIILLSITLVVGFGLFGYVNSAVANAERSYAIITDQNIKELQESFVIVTANFSSSSLSLWFYNSGNLSTSIQSLVIWNDTSSLFLVYNSTKVIQGASSYDASIYENPILPLSLSPGVVTSITLTLPSDTFNTGRVYYVRALGTYGNTYTYFQVR